MVETKMKTKITRYRFINFGRGLYFMEAEAEKNGKKYYCNIGIIPGTETFRDECDEWVYGCPVSEVDFNRPETFYAEENMDDVFEMMVEKWNASPSAPFNGKETYTDWIVW